MKIIVNKLLTPVDTRANPLGMKSKPIWLRLPEDVLEEVDQEVVRREKSSGMGLSRVGVLAAMIKERLKSLARSRKRSTK